MDKIILFVITVLGIVAEAESKQITGQEKVIFGICIGMIGLFGVYMTTRIGKHFENKPSALIQNKTKEAEIKSQKEKEFLFQKTVRVINKRYPAE